MALPLKTSPAAKRGLAADRHGSPQGSAFTESSSLTHGSDAACVSNHGVAGGLAEIVRRLGGKVSLALHVAERGVRRQGDTPRT
jgi:hypothetical protein